MLLSAMGLTVVIVWPQDGPGAFVREKVLRPLIPGKLKSALDCYICFGFWAGLVVSLPFWWFYQAPWTLAGCLMVPAVFWMVLKNPTSAKSDETDSDEPAQHGQGQPPPDQESEPP